MDSIAVQKLIFIRPDGTRTPGAIQIGKPCVVADGEARRSVAIEGLHDDLGDIEILYSLTFPVYYTHSGQAATNAAP